jgi:hypothetical protein
MLGVGEYEVNAVDDKKIWEMARRGGFTLNISGRQELCSSPWVAASSAAAKSVILSSTF